MTASYNLIVQQATTFTFQFVTKTGDVPWNLTGYTATMTVRPFLGATSTTIVGTNSNGIITLDPLNGRATVDLTDVQTNIKAQAYVYDFVFTSPSDEVTRILEGQFIVVAGVTV